MRAIALLVLLPGCFMVPYPGGGFGEAGKPEGTFSEKQFQYCAITEDPGYGRKNVEGEWQDYKQTFSVLSLKEGNATLRAISTEGKVETVASGTYSVEGEKVTLAWADGKSEVVDAYVEDIPGCEMLTPRGVEGTEPRISTEMYFERVTCDFSAEKQAEVAEQVR